MKKLLILCIILPILSGCAFDIFKRTPPPQNLLLELSEAARVFNGNDFQLITNRTAEALFKKQVSYSVWMLNVLYYNKGQYYLVPDEVFEVFHAIMQRHKDKDYSRILKDSKVNVCVEYSNFYKAMFDYFAKKIPNMVTTFAVGTIGCQVTWYNKNNQVHDCIMYIDENYKVGFVEPQSLEFHYLSEIISIQRNYVSF